jgi:F-type H+-transporting ATPase subunit b
MHRFSLLLGMMVLLAIVVPTYAADEAHGPAPGPLDIMYDTAIWAIVVFVGMLLILRTKAWGPILEGLKKREEAIRSSLEEAKKTRADMETIHEQLKQEVAEAHQQIPALMEEARKKAEEMANDMRAKASADIQADRARQRHEVEVAKDQAIKEMWEQAAQLATLISAKAIGRSLTEDDHRRLLDEAMAEMRESTRN